MVNLERTCENWTSNFFLQYHVYREISEFLHEAR